MSARDWRMLMLAAGVGARRADARAFRLGAVGLRADGVLVVAANGPATEPAPTAHAEARLSRKLGRGGEAWVARIKRDGSLAMARPCRSCSSRLRASGARRVCYSIGPGEYGVIE